MPVPDYCTWLRATLDEYRDLWQRRQDAIGSDYDWMHQSEYHDSKRSLAAEVNLARENPLIAAYRWWQEREQGFVSEAQRLRHLWLLLHCLDSSYSDKRLERGGGLLLGRRWWNVAMRLDGIRDQPKPTAGCHFPHLRVVDLRDHEWIPLAETEAAFAPVRRGKKLRVGLCCLSGRVRTFFRPTRVLLHEQNTTGFLAQGINSRTGPTTRNDEMVATGDPEYTDELRACVGWARENKVQILCFPELCVCPKGLAALRTEIEKGAGELSLVIPGSYHISDGSGTTSNAAPIWLIERGRLRELPAYEKADPMVIENPRGEKRNKPEIAGILAVAEFADQNGCGWIKEDIREGTIARLLYTPVGVIAVTICKDLLWAERTHLQRLADVADVILVVSMNTAGNRFWPKAESLCPLGTAVFYVNTPQSVPPTDSETEIAFWYLPRVQTAAPEEHPTTQGTRLCLFRTAPVGRTGGKFANVSSVGREMCELDFSDERFTGLLTEF